jgi:(1->4)-alpha-D-glucan 1-alpha-D-glucosylmutase
VLVRAEPVATYRVQLREEFDFDAAAAIVPYLEELGISHLYCSPYMQAVKGSTHGYDVVDPTRVSDDLGGDTGLRRLDAALREAGMGQLLDVVPNHMCITDRANTWWWSVLSIGRGSAYAHFFDIDWDAPAVHGRVLLPVLGAPRAELLAEGALRVAPGPDGRLELHYEASAFPLAADTASRIGPVSLETLDAQHYIVEDAATGAAHLNYRRFFDVSSLAGVRVEDAQVCDAVLARALNLVADGTVDGLRVDHIDGLRDPGAFADRLRAAAPDAWVVVEKILARDEYLPPTWPIDGTTGYEFGSLMTALMVRPEGLAAIDDAYREFSGDRDDFQAHAHRARREIQETLLSAELARLTRAAATAGIVQAHVELVELIAGMPRYRIYPQAGETLSLDDERAIEIASARAIASGRCDEGRLHAILSILRCEGDGSVDGTELRARFQQVASAVMAKGVEDTAFYRYVRLVALNEVGADPDVTSTLDDFHAMCGFNVREQPATLLATTTHDTKRAEDARIRIAMLSEIPERWSDALAVLHEAAARLGRDHMPSRQAEYLFYQTLVGASPLTADRAWAYMLKASREAKDETSWIEPNERYEAALEDFVRAMIDDPEVRAEINAVIECMTPEWQILSLSQTLIKLTAPGIPDIYQGSELWDLRLVDPDNRTPVDFAARRSLLHEVMSADGGAFMSRLEAGAPKLRVIAGALAVRGRHMEAFNSGPGYERVPAAGARAEHAICFARMSADAQPATVTIAVRWPILLRSGWWDTVVHLPEGRWRDAFTGSQIDGGEQRVQAVLAQAPVALLERM